MRFGAINKFLIILLLCVANACGQTEAERIAESHKLEDRAMKLRQKGELENAILEQRKAIELNPKAAEPLIVLAGMYIEAEDWNDATEIAKKAIEIDPKQAWGHSLLALALEKSGKRTDALIHRKEAAKLDSENMDFLVNLGVAYENLGDNLLAIEAYELALKRNGNYVYALLRLALLEIEMNRVEKGKQHLLQIVNLPTVSEKDQAFVKEAKVKLDELPRKSP